MLIRLSLLLELLRILSRIITTVGEERILNFELGHLVAQELLHDIIDAYHPRILSLNLLPLLRCHVPLPLRLHHGLLHHLLGIVEHVLAHVHQVVVQLLRNCHPRGMDIYIIDSCRYLRRASRLRHHLIDLSNLTNIGRLLHGYPSDIDGLSGCVLVFLSMW